MRTYRVFFKNGTITEFKADEFNLLIGDRIAFYVDDPESISMRCAARFFVSDISGWHEVCDNSKEVQNE